MSRFRRSSVGFQLRQWQEIAQVRREAELAVEATEADKGAVVAVSPVKR